MWLTWKKYGYYEKKKHTQKKIDLLMHMQRKINKYIFSINVCLTYSANHTFSGASGTGVLMLIVIMKVVLCTHFCYI